MKETIRKCLADRNILILIIVTIGLLPDMITTGGFYIHSDATTQMLPFVYETKRMLASGLPFWSWNTYLGDNFYSSYAFYTLFNPFTWINCLFPYAYLGIGFTLVLYLKFLLCGYVTQKYLEKLGFDVSLALTGSLLYTFSSWAVSNLFYYMFVEPMIVFPLLLLFVERFFRGDRHAFTGLAAAVWIVVMINYYFAPANLIAAAIYFFIRLAYLPDAVGMRWRLAVRAAAGVALGILCSAAMLVPVGLHLSHSSHAPFPGNVLNVYEITDRILWLLFPKAHEAATHYVLFKRTWNSNAAGIAIFGLLPLVLLYFRKGHGWIKWYAGVLIVLYATPLNLIFSLFTEPHYTRWAYALSLSLIIATLCYLRDFGLPRMRYAAVYCVVVYGAFFVFDGFSIRWQAIHSDAAAADARVPRLMLDACLVAVNAASLLLLCGRRSRSRRSYYPVVAAAAVCATAGMLTFSIPNAGGFPQEARISGENEYFRRGSHFRTDSDFSYRTDFSRLGPERNTLFNMGLICNRPSLQTFHSVQDARTHRWNQIVGKLYDKHRAFYPEKFRESFEALMSVKESVVLADEVADTCISGKPIGKEGFINVYALDHYIPMGFAYDTYVRSDAVEALMASDPDRDIPLVLLSALAVAPEHEKELSAVLSEGSVDIRLSLDSVVNERRRVVCDSFLGHSRGFDAHISTDRARAVFFSVIADEGFKAFIDGVPTKIYETNIGLSTVVVPEGSHRISFRFFPPGLKLGLILSVFGFACLSFLFIKGF